MKYAKGALRAGCNHAIKQELHGAKVSSDAGLFPYRDLDETAQLTDSSVAELFNFRTGSNVQYGMTALLRQSVYSRVVATKRLGIDATMRRVVGGRAKAREAASTREIAGSRRRF